MEVKVFISLKIFREISLKFLKLYWICKNSINSTNSIKKKIVARKINFSEHSRFHFKPNNFFKLQIFKSSNFFFFFSKISVQENFAEFIFLASISFQIFFALFIRFYYGNEIISESEKIQKIFFSSEWYKEDKQFRSSAKIFMESTKRAMAISIYGFFKVDLHTFVRICNGAYSLFTVFKRVK